MKKIRKILLALLVSLFINSYVYAEDGVVECTYKLPSAYENDPQYGDIFKYCKFEYEKYSDGEAVTARVSCETASGDGDESFFVRNKCSERVPNVSTGSNIYIVANSVNDFCINKKRISPSIMIDIKATDAYRKGYKCADLVVRYLPATFGDESGITLSIEGAIDPDVANSLILDNSTDEEAEIIPGKENDKYSNIETCTDVDVNHIKACGCIPAEVADITSKVYFILRLIGPIILLVIGGFEMAKAVASQDESAIEKAKKKLVNKFIAAAAIFLVLTIIKLGVSLVADNPDSIFECVNILLEGYVI